jgi:predicted amino acid dehydrogenase
LAQAAGASLARDVTQAVEAAAASGAEVVSLAGMIPAHTRYGFDVAQALNAAAPRVTTGHAATAASVVRTTRRALEESSTEVAHCTLAVIGVGSIGWSSLRLLLAVSAGAPRRLLLCDVASRARHLSQLVDELRSQGYRADSAVCGPDLRVPAAVYETDLIIAAISADRPVLDIDRLRPGTIVVDDSFPHCFDPRAALDRMADRRDVVVVGGGLLTAEPSQRTPADDPLLRHYAKHLTGLRLPDTVPSCQLEALMQVARPDLPPVRGLVDVDLALAYWEALSDLHIKAAPLHLLQQKVTPELSSRAFRRK